MLPAAYGAQQEVRARQRFERREAERQRLAKVIDVSPVPVTKVLLRALTQAVGRTRRVAGTTVAAIRAGYASSPGPNTESC
jgi:hypothetical protein